MEWWQALLGAGGLLIPVIIAAFARDRQMFQAIALAKEDAARLAEAKAAYLDDRINRVRDEYVRRDDLDGHLQRIDKRLVELREDGRRDMDQLQGELREIKQLVNLIAGAAAAPKHASMG